MLQLTRPLVFFDLETTGLDKENDRIVQIAMHKIMPGFKPGPMLSYLVNPQMPIPNRATAVHGITDAMLEGAPLFRDIAGEVYSFLMGCDVGGFNSNTFDVPFLFNELMRAGFIWDSQSFFMIDVGNIFKIREPRTLSAAVSFYCKREMENAHDAGVDIMETVNVFMAQLERYDDLPDTIEAMAIYTNHGCKVADLSGKFYYDLEGGLRFAFGKYRGELASDHLDFVQWMYFKATFPTDTNEICAGLLNLHPADDQPF